MSNEAIMRQKDIRPPPCEIDYKGMRFLITDRPNDQIIHNYVAVSNIIFFINCFKTNKKTPRQFCFVI